MNRETFLRLVRHPEPIADSELEDLEELAASFPYCQLAHLLVARGSYERSSMLALQNVKRAAAHVLDRSLLKKFVLGSSLGNAAAHAWPGVPASPPVEVPITEVFSEATPLTYPIAPDQGAPAEDALIDALAQELPPVTPASDDDRADEKQRQFELIEKFIATQPRIANLPGHLPDQPEQDLSEKSSALNKGVVSESLAKIMVKQGKNGKAAEIYRELMAMHPEKSAYFAEKLNALP